MRARAMEVPVGAQHRSGLTNEPGKRGVFSIGGKWRVVHRHHQRAATRHGLGGVQGKLETRHLALKHLLVLGFKIQRPGARPQT